MSTTDITLSTQEKKELEKRGFLVKESFSFKQLITSYIWNIWAASYLGLILGIIFELLGILNTWFMLFIILVCILFIARILILYTFLWKAFINKYQQAFNYSWIEAINKNISSIKQLQLLSDYIRKAPTRFFKEMKYDSRGEYGVSIWSSIFKKILLILPSIVILIIIWFNIWNNTWSIMILSYFWLPILSLGLRQLVEKYNPLYAFGNLGEKIQKITPQISEKSQEIQQNFVSDMNYRVLSDGFDGLASTFAQIVSLVIRLEKIEQKANKGNLFNSEKYISSLRSDIVWPLRSLRSFLDSKRTELATSREELSRVRVQVGGTSESRDLASTRTEPLLAELTESIDQLDMMIEKMG